MAAERKVTMLSVRLPASLVARTDFVVRNNDGGIRNRSEALNAALEYWLADQEQRLEILGVTPKKVR